jgi:hypothetical protein
LGWTFRSIIEPAPLLRSHSASASEGVPNAQHGVLGWRGDNLVPNIIVRCRVVDPHIGLPCECTNASDDRATARQEIRLCFLCTPLIAGCPPQSQHIPIQRYYSVNYITELVAFQYLSVSVIELAGGLS